MRQPLGAGPISCACFLPYPDCVTDVAFEQHDDMLCVPRQLANVLGISLAETLGYFDEFLETDWQQRGATALEIKELCTRQGRAFYFLSGTKMLDTYEPPIKSRIRAIALNCLGRTWVCVYERTCSMYATCGQL